MSTAYQRGRRVFAKRTYPKVGLTKTQSGRNRRPVHGVQARAFRGPVRQPQKPAVKPTRWTSNLTDAIVQRFFRLHETPAWCRRIAELWKERRR